MSTFLNDPCPGLKPAGYIPPTDGTTAEICLNEARMKRPETPEKLKKYLNWHKHQVGRVKQDDPDISRSVRYGRQGNPDGPGSVARPVSPGQLHGYILGKQEEVYASHKREPLGKAYSRGSADVKPGQDQPAHGIRTNFSESAKKLMYHDAARKVPTKSFGNTPEALNNIVKPITRNYDWDKTAMKGDPANYRFGKSQVGKYGAVGSQLERDIKMANDSKLISKRVIDIRNRNHYPIGRCRNPSGNVANLPKDYVFGRRNKSTGESTHQCIHEGYAPEDQQPDKDLGVSTYIAKGLTINHAPDRVFGLPSLRTDIIAPKRKSVADPHNYGDEHGVKDVLYPESYAYEGVEEKDYLQVREAGEIRKIFSGIGVDMSDEEFKSLAAEAEALFGGLSIDSFRAVYNKKTYGIGAQ